MRRLLVLALLAAPAAPAFAQTPPATAPAIPPANPYVATPGAARLEAGVHRNRLAAASLVANVPFRNVGPTVMGGRVVDVDVSPTDANQFYVAYASGGLWVTRNGGNSFAPVFDQEASMTIGDVAVDWAHGERLWVGTGEKNSSRSSYAGTGIYVSADSGKTWTHRGLEDSHHTGRVVLHPTEPFTAWVGALGPLYSPDGQRGVFKTTDGGATWRQTLPLAGNTGIVDMVIDPSNPAVLYASAWERTRRAWDFTEAGAGSGIYKSTDGGETWARLNVAGSGFPTGADVGRIGLDVFRGNTATVYAVVDNQARRPKDPNEKPAAGLTRERLRTMPQSEFLALAPALIDDFLDTAGYPASYTAGSILEMVRAGTITPLALVEYLEDANANLFSTPVVGAEVYRSDDGGATWKRAHEGYLDNVYFSYGYYFAEIKVAPQDASKVYIMGVPILKSADGGKTWANINGDNVHADHHALWVNPARAGHLINGNDGGLNVSFDDGATWSKANTPAVGQFYAVQTDDATPFNVYGGLQDNGVWKGPSTYRASRSWHEEGRYPYERIGGGDGMQVEVDTRDNETAYYGFQFGFYARRNADAERPATVRPQHALGERPPRFNWQSPIHLSRHNQDVLYFGADKFYRSFDQGKTFAAISPDLTGGPRAGDVPYGTISTIDESPKRFGLLYAGTDDGHIHVSRDAGFTWQKVSGALPPNLWVSRVEASNHAEGRVYASLNGYRWDHTDAYAYRSDDYGATWTRLGTGAADGLPAEPVNVIHEDPHNANVVYVGTDHGLYVSLDRGASFMAMMGTGSDYGADVFLPHVAVHDVKVHARDRDLVVGTHGRSLYVADVALVEALDSTMLARPVHAFPLTPITVSPGWGRRSAAWNAPNAPATSIAYFAGGAGSATIRVKTADGTVLKEWQDGAQRGLNYVRYELDADEARLRRPADRDRYPRAENNVRYLVPGAYTVEVTLGGHTSTTPLEVKPVPPRRRRGVPTEAGTEG